MPVRTLACLAIALAAVGWLARPAPAARRDWTGSAACGACHPAEFAAWQVTPHATTRARFASRPDPSRTDRFRSAAEPGTESPCGEGPPCGDPSRTDRFRSAAQPGSESPCGEGPPCGEARCLACHATGEAPAGPVVAFEVGCEACHGAGAAYAEIDLMQDRPVARALGLTDVSTPQARASVCAGCHRVATRGTPFDPTAPVHPR